MAGEVLTVFYLWINARNDIKKRQIVTWTVSAYVAAGIFVMCYQGVGWSRLVTMLVYAILLGGFSILSKGAMGMGDVLIISSLGIMLDFWKFMAVIGMGLLSAGIYSGILLVMKKAKRKTEIPFVPFLLLGYVGGLCIW